MAPSLFDIPLEVLQLVVRLLDPISVIALSQTCSAWRALISPLRYDHVQRLLALELLPEHGGIVPHFDEFASRVTPPWASDEWKSARYACCGCMKLRTHMMFDNHAILRRPYRKPPPGSVEAGRVAITEWEPFEPSIRWRRIQERAARAEAERRRWRRTAHRLQDDALLHPPAHPFALVPLGPNDGYHEAMTHLIGTERQRRRCIDCQRRRGQWSRPDPPGGSREILAVKSRQLVFSSAWERHFPGLFEPLPPEKVPRTWRALQDWSAGDYHNLYLVCCPSCGEWQEHSAFRHWDLFQYGFQLPQHPKDPLLCNRCHLRTHHDPALLARELSAAALEMLRSDCDAKKFALAFGWRFLDEDLHSAPFAQYGGVVDEILDGLKWESEPGDRLVWEGAGRRKVLALEDADLPDLSRRFERYRKLIYDEVDAETRSQCLQSWFKLWVEDYDLFEGRYRWLKERIVQLERDPNLVLNYVLERDPYRI